MSNWDNEPHIIQGFGPAYEAEVGVGDTNTGLFDSNIRRLVFRSKGDSETPVYFDNGWDNEPHIIQGFGPDKQYYLFSYEAEVGVGDTNTGLFDSNIRRLVIRSKGDSETPVYFDNGWVTEPKSNVDKWMLRMTLRSLKAFNKKAKEYCKYDNT